MSEFKEGRDVEAVCAEMNSVDRLTDFARVCEQAERHEDMLVAVKAMTQRFLSDKPMTGESCRPAAPHRSTVSHCDVRVMGCHEASSRVCRPTDACTR